MKKTKFFIFFYTTILCGCATTMRMDKTIDLNIPNSLSKNTEPDLEFIGFEINTVSLLSRIGDSVQIYKNDVNYVFPSEYELWETYKNNTCVNIGSLFQNANISYDQLYADFGTFSLQELEQYKSKKRFVTFIEVNTHRLRGTVKDGFFLKGLNTTLAGIACSTYGGMSILFDPDNDVGFKERGMIFTGMGVTLLAAGVVFLAIPAKTTLIFNGNYQVYVYDTQTKQIIYNDAVTVSEKDMYTGSYFNKKTNKNAINSYYAKLVCNKFLEKYTSVIQFIHQYEK